MAFIEFFPILRETVHTIRGRLDADANAGLDPADSRFADTTEGGFYWDTTQAPALEIARLYDFLSAEVPSAALPQFAWGTYLDSHAAVLNLNRKAAVKASGVVAFTGTAGTLVPSGTQIGTVQTDPDVDPVIVATIESYTLAAGPVPTGVSATPFTTGGTLAIGTYYYKITATVPSGETAASAEVSAAITTATGRVALAWSAVSGATGYNIYRSTVSGTETLLVSGNVPTTYSDTGAAALGGAKPPTNDIDVEALATGPYGNVAAGTLTQLLTGVSGVTAVTNPLALSGGADVESDERLRERILLEYASPPGAGNVSDYERWALAYPAVGYVTVEPLWAGAGTVRVIITDQNNDPVSASVVAALQAILDPVAQQGRGLAPIGALVTVAAPVSVTVNVAATLTMVSGYTIDGTNGTIAVRENVEAAIKDYIDKLVPGGDVIRQKVMARIVEVTGVSDVTACTLNAGSSNISISALQVSTTGTITLT